MNQRPRITATALYQTRCILGFGFRCPRSVGILELVAMGKIKPQLAIDPLDEISRVLARLADGRVRHRAIVTRS